MGIKGRIWFAGNDGLKISAKLYAEFADRIWTTKPKNSEHRIILYTAD